MERKKRRILFLLNKGEEFNILLRNKKKAREIFEFIEKEGGSATMGTSSKTRIKRVRIKKIFLKKKQCYTCNRECKLPVIIRKIKNVKIPLIKIKVSRRM